MNDRRQGDRRVPPAVAQHAIEERAELLARIEDQAREIDRLSAGGAKEYWRGRCMDAEMALKAQPIGVVLPERKDPDGYSAGSPEWHAAHAHNDCMDEVALLNSPPVSAGVVDELAFDTEKGAVLFCEARGIDDESPYRDRALDAFVSGAAWQARAAQPDHSAQSRADGLMISVEDVEHLKHARRELTRLDRAPLYIRQALAQKITNMLAAAPAPGKKEGGDL